MASEHNFSPRSWADAETTASGLDLRPGLVVAGKYRLVRPAGFGGMGAVWVAQNEMTAAEVALKILLASESESQDANVRFRREAHAAAKLSHRGIVRVFDLVELEEPHAGTLVMVMELLRGETLADRFDRQQKFGVEEALGIFMPLLSALAHAHEAGIIHRDLKPENVFLSIDPDGHVTPKILDFGISKLTSSDLPTITGAGDLLGTPSYMSPEQARGLASVDARSDVFTMGILLYEMILGRNPFNNGSYHSVVAAILEREPEPLTELTPELWAVLARALSKSPSQRYADAKELSAAIRETGLSPALLISSPPPAVNQVVPLSHAVFPTPRRPNQPTMLTKHGVASRRRRALNVFGFVFAAVCGIGIVALVVGRLRAADPVGYSAPPDSTLAIAVAPAKAAGASSADVASHPLVTVESLPIARGSATAAKPETVRKPPRGVPNPPRAQEPMHPPASPVPPPKSSGVARDPGF